MSQVGSSSEETEKVKAKFRCFLEIFYAKLSKCNLIVKTALKRSKYNVVIKTSQNL